MDWTKNACHHQRSKHVAIKYFFVRDTVRDKLVKISYVNTKENEADILTKNTLSSANIFNYPQPKMMNMCKTVVNKFVKTY